MTNRRASAGLVVVLLLALVAGGLLDYCREREAVVEVAPATPIVVTVLPATVLPTPTVRDIFTVPTSSPELVGSPPLPTATSTPTAEPAATAGPTETRVPATLVQRG